MVYGDFKDFARRTASNKILRDQAFNIAKNLNLADMQLIRKFNKRIRFLLCVIYTYSKYACVISLKDKKGITITNAFQKSLYESNRKPNTKNG